MITIISYIGFLISFVVATLSLYLGLLKIRLI
nr:cytochrome b6/f complex subunit VI [Watanabea sichuanensis]WDY13190.1 cytochrome b6/f complex subunit VI [Watanabea sichuanensis]